ncbi:hypothetical protein [Fulvimonas soli]|uniref:Oxidoreductase family protein n=1 Tax=Fulvimonas soli TaxID=155197 RepID=A0A316IJE1_9GAMM|nr:hypothetical protein [Fulvimonas soli]PWK92584.1 oxidoreductase family protein [Fulvimonas soli]TNY27790.1 hypothetical protein BV497_01880 [Fulvimonas soli]
MTTSADTAPLPHGAVNRRILLAARPRGLPTARDFRLDEAPVPQPRDGQVLLRTLYLSLDPYMRNLMDEGGTRYAPAVPLGAPMVGGAVSRVVASRHPGFPAGELVLGNAGWQGYALSDGGDLAQPSLALGGLGMPAFAACVGLLDIGQPKPGETVVVAAATGAFAAFRRDMGAWLAAGRVRLRKDRVEGLENAPATFIGLLEGRNFGKLVVRVAGE